MKKVILVVVLVVSLTLAGCTNDDTRMKNFENAMEEYGKSYFENYVPVQGMSQVDIRILDLKNAVDHADADYDLSKLDGCTDNSMVKLILKPDSRDIESVEFDMNCK